MNVKELFDKAENGTLTYDQFIAAAGTAKFVDLTEGNYVSKNKFDDEIRQRDTRITTLSDTIKTRDTDLQNLQNTIKDAGDIEALKTASRELGELQKKYDKETKAYQKQLADQQYEFAVKEFANTKKFTSAAAKREFTRAMVEKKLSLENGTIIGADDFVKMYTENNADSFVTEPAQAEPPKPQFVNSTPGANPQSTETNPFIGAFHFTGVRPMNQNKGE